MRGFEITESRLLPDLLWFEVSELRAVGSIDLLLCGGFMDVLWGPLCKDSEDCGFMANEQAR